MEKNTTLEGNQLSFNLESYTFGLLRLFDSLLTPTDMQIGCQEKKVYLLKASTKMYITGATRRKCVSAVKARVMTLGDPLLLVASVVMSRRKRESFFGT